MARLGAHTRGPAVARRLREMHSASYRIYTAAPACAKRSSVDVRAFVQSNPGFSSRERDRSDRAPRPQGQNHSVCSGTTIRPTNPPTSDGMGWNGFTASVSVAPVAAVANATPRTLSSSRLPAPQVSLVA
jgi:hypothetical protein